MKKILINVVLVGNKDFLFFFSMPNYILGDSLSYHHGQAFATKDRDATEHGKDKVPCSTVFQGAWWYKTCQISNLNGVYLQGEVDPIYHGVTWKKWRGKYYSLRTTEMKIRRK